MVVNNITKSLYEKEDNFQIVDFNNNSNICYVFFSSNAVCYGYNHSYECVKGRFEWQNIAKSPKIEKKARRIIFLRDIQSSFYVEGINSTVDTIDKTVLFLKANTRGLDLYLVGLSAGAYIAVICSRFLSNVKRVYSFGGIFFINLYQPIEKYPVLLKHINDLDYCKYLKLNKDFFQKNSILHFYASENESDNAQLDWLVDNEIDIVSFGFANSYHGKTIYSYDYPDLLSCSDKKIKYIINKFANKKNINPRIFSIMCFGLIGWAIKMVNHKKHQKH